MKKIKILVTGGGSPGIAGTIYSLKNNYDNRAVDVVCTDAKNNCVGKYLSDKFYQIPKATDVEEYLSNWGKIFREAKTMLEAPISKENYLSYLQGYISNEDCIKLLSAGAKSSVFGGMGSWNDIGGFDKEEHSKLYDELSVELYSELNNSFLTAVNFRG